MILVTDHIHPNSASKSRIPIRIDRHTLAKRRFRANADDSTDFGFDLVHPLSHGDSIHETEIAVYFIEQLPEPVLKIPFHDGQTGAQYGWMVGNMHFSAAFSSDAVIAEDDPAVRQMLDRAHLHYYEANEIFQPATNASAHQH